MSLETLSQNLDSLKRSSRFIAGDPGSFKIKFAQGLELPGKDDPGDYLDRLGLKVTPERVFVLFPGNGGLCVEALKRGATTVMAVEPRESFLAALVEVSGYSAQILGKTFSTIAGSSGYAGWREQFDVVVWSEGLERCTDPMRSITNVLELLRPGGTLFIEVTHGQQELIKPPVNSWRPKEEVFEAALYAACPSALVAKLKGRLDRRVIYSVRKPEAPPTPEVVQVPQEVVEDFKKDPEGPIRDAAGEPTKGPDVTLEPSTPVETSDADEKPKKISMKKKKA